MKVAILSDFHLGYERFREDAYNQAREALEKAAGMSDAIIIPGDIFDNRAPRPDVIAEAVNLFRDLAGRKWAARVTGFVGNGVNYTDVPVIAIPGTHERRAQDAADPVDILGLAGLVVDVSDATAIIEGGGEKVAVRGIGGIADDRFREAVARSAPVPTDGAFNIFVFHESLYELLPFDQDFMRIDELPKGFDLYVCGHIHNKVEAEVHGKKLLIPGSTVLTQLKEGEQERKGFFLFDTKSRTYEFVPIGSRRFVFVKVDLGGSKGGDAAALVMKSIERAIGDGRDVPVIRVVLDGRQGRPQASELEINDMPRKYAGRAIVEISKTGMSGAAAAGAEHAAALAFERMSVKDYAIGVFTEKIRSRGVSTGRISPVELLDILGADTAKDKAVKKAMDELLAS